MNNISNFAKRYLFPTVLIAFGIIYVGNTWSPSSYGCALNILGSPREGLILGSPRAIRSDEWAVFTPMVQALVNNDFGRINKTSFYNEDMRNMFALPIADWGMLFKPTLAAFFILDPAHAYSLHWFLLMVLFVIGYARLFRLTGISVIQSYLVSGTVFYSGFVVGWWTILGPVMAWFPWVLEACRSKISDPWRFLLVYWVLVCWMLSFFYPPLIISLTFLGLILLFVYTPSLFKKRKLLLMMLASLLAVITVIFYLKDYIIATWGTIYPGQRSSAGGVPNKRQVLEQLFPSLNSVHYHSLIGANICEIGVVGTLIPLFTIPFVKLTSGSSKLERRAWLLVMGLILMLCWILLPIPEGVGRLILWNRVPPVRMLFAEGVLCIFVSLLLIKRHPYTFSMHRISFVLFVCFGFIVYKYLNSDVRLVELWRDSLVILILAICVFIIKTTGWSALTVLLSGCFIFNVFINGGFNPIQSTRPIFDVPSSSIIEGLDIEYKNNNQVLAVPGFPGMILNGLGYRSVSHVLAVPIMDFWKEKYGDTLTDDELNILFNRYEHVVLSAAISKPTLMQADAVVLPVKDFVERRDIVVLQVSTIDSMGAGGHIDSINYSKDKIEFIGWALWLGRPRDRVLGIHCNRRISELHAYSIMRPDVAKALKDGSLLYSGFRLLATVASGKENNLSCRVYSKTEKTPWMELRHEN